MLEAKKKALEAAGYRVGDAAEFLELTDAERRLVELRAQITQGIRRRRTGAGLTQKQVAQRIGTTQARVARIEAGEPGISLDQCFRAFFAVEGTLEELTSATSG